MDAIHVIRQLDADVINRRLVELERERAALRVLLRAARARQRAADRASPEPAAPQPEAARG